MFPVGYPITFQTIEGIIVCHSPVIANSGLESMRVYDQLIVGTGWGIAYAGGQEAPILDAPFPFSGILIDKYNLFIGSAMLGADLHLSDHHPVSRNMQRGACAAAV